jgi:hypothetical protein
MTWTPEPGTTIPRFFPGEQDAIARVLKAGEEFGYGNMIQQLSLAWSKMLQEKWGLSKEAADRSAFDPEALLKFGEQQAKSRIADLERQLARAKAIEEAASNAVPMMQMAWKQYGVGGMFECMDALRAALAKIGGGA